MPITIKTQFLLEGFIRHFVTRPESLSNQTDQENQMMHADRQLSRQELGQEPTHYGSVTVRVEAFFFSLLSIRDNFLTPTSKVRGLTSCFIFRVLYVGSNSIIFMTTFY
jgi:hypothetical protein